MLKQIWTLSYAQAFSRALIIAYIATLTLAYLCTQNPWWIRVLTEKNAHRVFLAKIHWSLESKCGRKPTCFSCALWCEGSSVARSWWAAKDGSLSTWWKHVLRSRSFRVVKELSLGWRTKETNFQLIFRPVSSSSNKIITFQKTTCLFHK